MTTTGCPIECIVKRDGTMVTYDRDRITTAIFNAASAVGGSDRSTASALAQQVQDILIDTYYPDSIPTVEDIQDVVESVLIENGHARTARAFIIYRHDRARARDERDRNVEANDNIPYRKIYEVLRWNVAHGCDTVSGLNEIIARGEFLDLIEASEQRYCDEVARGAEAMIAQAPEARLVIIAGPSSSSKTTTTIKASERLQKEGLQLRTLNVDHYFFDLEMHPKDEFGDYDYETPQALDLALINEHLSALMDGKTIKTPHYDFKTGKRQLGVYEMSLASNELLLIDSLHGLYEDMTASIPKQNKFRLYIETLGQLRNDDGTFLRWSDNRLMRRMIRDSWHRNLRPMQTLTHWHYVRRSELQNIIPFIGSVDYLVNSALPYEMPILKHKLFKFFPTAMEEFQSVPKRKDAYIRAKRVFEMLEPLTLVEDDKGVPGKSLLREFIGGSDYEY